MAAARLAAEEGAARTAVRAVEEREWGTLAVGVAGACQGALLAKEEAHRRLQAELDSQSGAVGDRPSPHSGAPLRK